MSSQNLRLQVMLQAVDRLTGPLRSISRQAQVAGEAMKQTREKLKGLGQTQKNIGDFRTLRQGLEATRTQLEAARQRTQMLGRQMSQTTNPTAAMRRAFDQARAGLSRLEGQETSQVQKLQQLRQRLADAGVNTRELGRHERRLAAEIAAGNLDMAEQQRRLAELTRRQERLTRATQAYSRAQQTAGQMAGAGAKGMAVGGVAMYAGARMMAPGLEFDASMSKVQSLTRLDKNSEDMQALRAQARELGAATQFTAGEAAGAQGFLAMAGFTPDAIKKAMPGMLDLAKAGGAELAETADVASNILTGFGVGADQMSRVGDILVGTFTRSNVDLAMLGETMKYVGPVAASVGQDIETVAAMAGKLGDAGIQGSMGGTALRAILGRLSAPPKAAADALAKLGISAKDASGNMRDLPTVLSEIYEKTKGMGNADRAGLLKGIAGEEAVSALQVLVKQAGTGALQEFVGTLKQTEGEASKTAKTMADNLKGDLSTLGSAWDDLGIQIQEQQDGPLRGLAQTIAGVVGSVKTWVAENPELAGTLVKMTAVLAALVAGGGAFMVLLAGLAGPLIMIRYAMTAFGIATNAALWPVLAIIAAVAALAVAGYLIYKHWEPIKAYFAGLWAQVKAAFSGGIGSIGALLLTWSPLGLFYKAFAGVMGYFGVELPGKFTEFGGMIINGLINGIKNAMGAVKDAVVGAGESAVGWFKEKLGIHSPSVVFAGLGGDTMDGLAQGLNDGQKNPLAALDDTSKQIIKKGGAIASNNPFAALADTGKAMPQLPEAASNNPFAALADTGKALPQLPEAATSNPFAALAGIAKAGVLAAGVGAMPAMAQLPPAMAEFAAAPIPLDTRAPISASANAGAPAAAAQTISVAGDTITIIIQASGGAGNSGDLEQQISRILDERERGKASRIRSQLFDQD